jgi:hypothetical protein
MLETIKIGWEQHGGFVAHRVGHVSHGLRAEAAQLVMQAQVEQ